MNRNEFETTKKEAISILDNSFVQSLEVVLSSLSEEEISIAPFLKDLKVEETFTSSCMVIDTEYTEGFAGRGRMVFRLNDAIPFTQLAMGEDIDQSVTELDELHQSVFNEIVSQVISSTSTAVSGKINKKINFSFPQILIFEDPSVLNGDTSSTIELFYSLKVGKLIDSVFLYQVPNSWLSELAGEEPIKKAPPVEEKKSPPPAPVKEEIPSPPVSLPPPEVQAFSAPPPEREVSAFKPAGQSPFISEETSFGYNNAKAAPVVQPAKFAQLASIARPSENNSLDLFLDVPMKLTAVLGRTVLYLKDVLDMGQGSVFELDRLAGEPIDLMVNNKLVARGEVVVIDEKFGVRVIETLQDQVKRKLA